VASSIIRSDKFGWFTFNQSVQGKSKHTNESSHKENDPKEIIAAPVHHNATMNL